MYSIKINTEGNTSHKLTSNKKILLKIKFIKLFLPICDICNVFCLYINIIPC